MCERETRKDRGRKTDPDDTQAVKRGFLQKVGEDIIFFYLSNF